MSGGRPGGKLTVVWLVLVALAVVIGLLKYSDWKSSHSDYGVQTEAERRSLLPVPIEELKVVEIGHAGALHRFERDQAGAWFYHAHGVNTGVQAPHDHVADPARAAQIARAFGPLGRARIERWLDDEDQQQYGVTRPQILLLIYADATAKPLAQYAFGDVAPDKFSRYVLIVDTSQVVTIAEYQAENLLNLIQAVNSPIEASPDDPYKSSSS